MIKGVWTKYNHQKGGDSTKEFIDLMERLDKPRIVVPGATKDVVEVCLSEYNRT